MNILTMIAQLILSLSILVVLHELGHFLPAKWFKTRVEKFYLFFDIKFSLLKKKIGETEYGIGWLPLGGYVKIAGMVDESLDTEQMKQEPQPWEFRSKPAWQRLIIMLGGVTVNFILGFFIFSMMLWGYGKVYLENSKLEYGIAVDSLGTELGLKDGDKLISIGGKEVKEFSPGILRREVVLNNSKQIVVSRENEFLTIEVDPKFVQVLSSNDYKEFSVVEPRFPFVIHKVSGGGNAEEAGLLAGDEVTYVNNRPAVFQNEVIQMLAKFKGENVRLGYKRDGKILEALVAVDEHGRIGVQYNNAADFGWTGRKDYTLAQAIPGGIEQGKEFMSDWFKGIAQLFNGKVKAKDSLGGFIAITNLFSPTWDWESFWRITAILSFILAIMNLIPIPLLDGGHVVILLFEMVTGKTPSDKFMTISTYVGLVLVFGLMLLANGFDILRLLGL
jgi:regulator of sigma E protease